MEGEFVDSSTGSINCWVRERSFFQPYSHSLPHSCLKIPCHNTLLSPMASPFPFRVQSCMNSTGCPSICLLASPLLAEVATQGHVVTDEFWGHFCIWGTFSLEKKNLKMIKMTVEVCISFVVRNKTLFFGRPLTVSLALGPVFTLLNR